MQIWGTSVDHASTSAFGNSGVREVRRRIFALKEQANMHRAAASARGDVVYESVFTYQDELLARAETTIAEVFLLVISKQTGWSRDRIRAEVRPVVRELRSEGQVMEKEVCHPTVFKNAYQAMLKS